MNFELLKMKNNYNMIKDRNYLNDFSYSNMSLLKNGWYIN